MRNFRHLSKTDIEDIIVRHYQGETNASIALSYECDPSTISYHVTKYERAYPEQGGIYAVIKVKVRKTCLHPSGRCTICGEMWDELRRKERDQIANLEKELREAHSRLRSEGIFVESGAYTEGNETTP